MYPLMPTEEIAAFATRPPGKLPKFKYAGPDLHFGDKAVVLGDVIHTIKPYFGLGVNSAMDDIAVLRRKLEACPVRSSSRAPVRTSVRGAYPADLRVRAVFVEAQRANWHALDLL